MADKVNLSIPPGERIVDLGASVDAANLAYDRTRRRLDEVADTIGELLTDHLRPASVRLTMTDRPHDPAVDDARVELDVAIAVLAHLEQIARRA